jgi:hypothetical protein
LKKATPIKKGKNPIVRVMSLMVDDMISANSVTSKVLTGDFTRESIREVMVLVLSQVVRKKCSITCIHHYTT